MVIMVNHLYRKVRFLVAKQFFGSNGFIFVLLPESTVRVSRWGR